MKKMTFLAFRGNEALPFAAELAGLRIQVFREYPYLYDGSLEYERDYLESYFSCSDSVVVLAKEGDAVVGAATGLPLRYAEAAWKKALLGTKYAEDSVFYFGESVLLKEYRGLGIGHRFFDLRESFARSLPGMLYTSFCSVIRGDGHAMKPDSYRSHDIFWRKRGYDKIPGVRAEFFWKDVSDVAETAKEMEFWIRRIDS